MKKDKVTTVKFNEELYNNFRAICVCEGVSISEQLNRLIAEFTKKRAGNAIKHFVAVAKRLENAS